MKSIGPPSCGPFSAPSNAAAARNVSYAGQATLVQTAVGLIGGIAGVFGIAGVTKYWPKSAMWGAALMILFYFLLYFGYFEQKYA